MMKKVFVPILGLLALLCQPAFSQQDDTEYLLGSETKISAFGGALTEFSNLGETFSISTGLGAALVLNRAFFVGGYRLRMRNTVGFALDGADYGLDLRHRGFWAGAIINPRKVVHVGLSSKLGWGDLTLRENQGKGAVYAKEQVLVVTPQIDLGINMTRWFRLNLSAGYRVVSEVQRQELQGGQYNSPTGSVSFLFGWFR